LTDGIATDVLGSVARITIDRALYSDAAIFKACYWFTDRYYVFIDSLPGNKAIVEFRLKADAADEELSRVTGEFCNSLLDFRLRQVILSETSAIREELVKKAFIEGKPRSETAA